MSFENRQTPLYGWRCRFRRVGLARVSPATITPYLRLRRCPPYAHLRSPIRFAFADVRKRVKPDTRFRVTSDRERRPRSGGASGRRGRHYTVAPATINTRVHARVRRRVGGFFQNGTAGECRKKNPMTVSGQSPPRGSRYAGWRVGSGFFGPRKSTRPALPQYEGCHTWVTMYARSNSRSCF